MPEPKPRILLVGPDGAPISFDIEPSPPPRQRSRAKGDPERTPKNFDVFMEASKKTRWPKGVGGGGPRKKKPLTKALQLLTDEPEEVREVVQGVWTAAKFGNVQAFHEIADRVDGPVTHRLSVEPLSAEALSDEQLELEIQQLALAEGYVIDTTLVPTPSDNGNGHSA